MSGDLVSPVLVGRQDELKRLRSLLDRAVGGEPAVALVAGEAGVGKTRLVQEISRIATDQSVRVLSGGCAELGGEGIPLAPLVDVLRKIVRSTPAEDLDQCFGAARREFARLLPELEPAVAATPVQEGSAAQLREHVLGLISRLAAHRPMLLIVEDLHWADRSTRDLVAFLVQTVHELGVFLLITYRSDELHRRHPLRPLVTAWERVRSVERLEVGRFSRDEVATQLQAIQGSAPTSQLTEVVYERSAGNAFLVEEILAAVRDGADPSDIPPSLRDVLLARTEAVSDLAQRILRTASAAGPRVEDRLLEIVVGAPEAQLYPALREAVEHHLLVVDNTGRGYTFRHALTRDALYDDMLPGERVRLHAAYGAALQTDPSLLGDDSTVAATVAHHWYAALDLPRALTASVRAGTQGAVGFTPAEALRHLERALQIWPRVPDAAECAGVDWTEVNIRAVEAAWAAGELHRALSIVDQVLATDEAAGDPVRTARLLERRCFVLLALGRDEEATRQLREALALLPTQPVTVTHAVVLTSLAASLNRLGDCAQGQAVARSAIDAAAAVGARAQQADALITLGIATAYLGDPQPGLTALRDGLALAERYELGYVALRGHINISDVLEMLGWHTQAAQAATVGITLATRIGYARSHGAMLVGNLAEPMLRLGRWREALDLVTESLADDPSGVYAGTLLLLRGELHLWQGDLDAASRDVHEVRRQLGDAKDLQFTAPMVYIEAELARSRGNLIEARQCIGAALDSPVTAFAVRYYWPLLWLGMRIEADIAATTSDSTERRASLHELAATIMTDTLPAQTYQALIRAETARLDRRAEVVSWAAAVAATRASAEAFLLCYSLYRLTEAHLASGDPSAATATAKEGLSLGDDLAATTADDIRTLARHARLRIEPTPPASDIDRSLPDRRFRLTDREREVLALVAEGRSNGQIASTLYISPKTASVHVSNILAKIGASTRTEAAAIAYRLGLLA